MNRSWLGQLKLRNIKHNLRQNLIKNKIFSWGNYSFLFPIIMKLYFLIPKLQFTDHICIQFKKVYNLSDNNKLFKIKRNY